MIHITGFYIQKIMCKTAALEKIDKTKILKTNGS